MAQQFTPDQIKKLQDLGINIDSKDISVIADNTSPLKPEVTSSLPLVEVNQIEPELSPSLQPNTPIEEVNTLNITNLTLPDHIKLENSNKQQAHPVFPLLSLSGLTLLSFGGLVLLKGNSQTASSSLPANPQIPSSDVSNSVTPTQVPKSIQHYLLTSQQYFSQAVSQQSSTANSTSTVELLNNSILAATEAIKEFPDDYRGYQQRASIYQALTESKPELIDQSISDFTIAFKLNSTSAEVTRSLASLYAKKGDAQNTIAYLNQTVALEPTKAQNFYDLAKIQQQAGLLSQALDTYAKLVPLITDATQKTQVETEKLALEKLVAQNPNSTTTPDYSASLPDPVYTEPSNIESPTIQASTGTGLIIAAPEVDDTIKVSNQTESNSLSGNATLPAGQKELTITNDNVISTSQVYVTITKGGKNQNFQVLSKSDKSFTAGLDSPLSEDVEFKWWIIN